MKTDWSKQESQLARLTTQAQRYLATFRWLWLLNLAAAVIGVATRHYWLTVVAAGSSVIALIGVAFARRGQKTVSEATTESHRIQHKPDLPSESDS
jgi:hypothetical protein